MFCFKKQLNFVLIFLLNVILIDVQCSDEDDIGSSIGRIVIKRYSGKIKNKLTNESIVLDTCGLSNTNEDLVNDKIVGGFDALEGQFPYQVFLRLRRKDSRVMICGGSILNDQWILTAAHCVSSEKFGEFITDSIEIRAGSIYREVKGEMAQMISADCVIQHEKWVGLKGGFANDIALIRLPSEHKLNITFKQKGNINGICLPMKSKTGVPFEYIGKARISGWGATSNKVIKSSATLQFTDVNLIDDKTCSKNNFKFPIVDSMICQGIDRTSPCFGDSGGPLVIRINGRYTQIGIVSTGPSKCANDVDPNGIYTQISHFLDWIENTVSRNSKKICFGFQLKQFAQNND